MGERARVFRLFLRPADCFRAGVFFQKGIKLGFRERIDLLQTHERDIGPVVLFLEFLEVVKNLSRRNDDGFD